MLSRLTCLVFWSHCDDDDDDDDDNDDDDNDDDDDDDARGESQGWARLWAAAHLQSRPKLQPTDGEEKMIMIVIVTMVSTSREVS